MHVIRTNQQSYLKKKKRKKKKKEEAEKERKRETRRRRREQEDKANDCGAKISRMVLGVYRSVNLINNRLKKKEEQEEN